MGKFGVGVGDEFPVDEGKPKDEASGGTAPGKDGGDGQCRGGRDGWHDRWRGDWHDDGRGYARYESRRRHDWYQPHAPHFLKALLILGGIALVIAVISHFFYVILGAAMVAALAFAYRGHHGAMWDMYPPASSQPK